MLKSDFNFKLPKELIALYPSKERTSCRMLFLDGKTGLFEDHLFTDLKSFLSPGDLLVFNDTKVIPARLFGRKETGGRVELLIERILTANTALALIKASKTPKEGSLIFLDKDDSLKVTGRQGSFFAIESVSKKPILDILESQGHVPLPPYIEREDEPLDLTRYQTVYSKVPGAVAAPTAGLHFDHDMMKDLQDSGVNIAWVTLHVGSGTFLPVRTDDIKEHHMHSEFVHVPSETAQAVIDTHKKGRRVFAVGTTAVRSLETAARQAQSKGLDVEICACSLDTSIFIYPGYQYQVVDGLITNFHLPESTLIMLVCAFAGFNNTLRAYHHAIAQKYQFFSYGDCMLILKRPGIDDLPPSY